MTELTQLLLCRQLFVEAERFLLQGERCSLGLAVSVTQDAIELFVRSAEKHIGMSLSKDKAGFTDVVNELSKELSARGGEPLPYRSKLEDINKARISFKHYGLSPTKEDAIRLVDYGEAFLADATRNIFNVDFLSLSYVDLIANSTLRTLVTQAKVHLEESRIEDSLCCSAQVVKLAMMEMERALPSTRIFNLGWNLPGAFGRSSEARETADKLGRVLNDAFDSFKEVAVLTGLSIDLQRYGKFRELTPVVHLFPGGTARCQFTQFTKQIQSKEDVAFCIAFATDFALAVQQRLPTHADVET